MVVALCGVPGVGKSHLAAALAEAKGWTVLDRDAVRDAVFPARFLDYSHAQNNLASELSYQVCAYILRKHPEEVLILDGRPFSLFAQREQIRRLARELGVPAAFIHCVASESVVLDRLARVNSDPSNDPRADRTEQKLRAVKQQFEPFREEAVIEISTEIPVSQQVETVSAYLMGLRAQGSANKAPLA
ncbi:MAG: ATP-binding protein [Spirochaetaceae bacterium]|nr:MAG: ATP-binding protein [Spirochaetaceae bacterium]